MEGTETTNDTKQDVLRALPHEVGNTWITQDGFFMLFLGGMQHVNLGQILRALPQEVGNTWITQDRFYVLFHAG